MFSNFIYISKTFFAHSSLLSRSLPLLFISTFQVVLTSKIICNNTYRSKKTTSAKHCFSHRMSQCYSNVTACYSTTCHIITVTWPSQYITWWQQPALQCYRSDSGNIQKCHILAEYCYIVKMCTYIVWSIYFELLLKFLMKYTLHFLVVWT